MYFKLLTDGNSAIWGTGTWPEVGQWYDLGEDSGELESCYHGLHLTDENSLAYWLTFDGDSTEYFNIYEAEYEGECIRSDDNKIVVRKARLVRSLTVTEDMICEAVITFIRKYLTDSPYLDRFNEVLPTLVPNEVLDVDGFPGWLNNLVSLFDIDDMLPYLDSAITCLPGSNKQNMKLFSNILAELIISENK